MATVADLEARGVTVRAPESVYVGPEVQASRISGEGVVIWPGCRVLGASTLLLPGAELGREAPVTLVDCQLGENVRLHGGFFEGATFLDGAEAGSAAHVRRGTLLEEGARTAHAVGLKQTILFPFVTLGSLINFCDILMTGGTGPKDHSEVGSSYIHFNYTPQKDKATASLVGNVPEGVFLNQRPIFLGGQGGMVGPRRLAHGTVVAAGTVLRKDELRPDRLIVERPPGKAAMPFDTRVVRAEKGVLVNNLHFLGNLLALRVWYLHVRKGFFTDGPRAALFAGALEKLDRAVAERLKRLGEFCGNLNVSARLLEETGGEGGAQAAARQRLLAREWPKALECFSKMWENAERVAGGHAFLEQFAKERPSGAGYVEAVQRLAPDTAALGAEWLGRRVQDVVEGMLAVFPALAE
jgi:UDP-N-acetylglucosamine/UDP-N-acetylgalactosamine diphosphorylase